MTSSDKQNSRMSHVRVSQSLNLRFGVFTVLLFHTVLLGLIHPCRGQHRVIRPSKLIVAPVGEDIILPSVLDPPVNAFGKTVEWTRPDLDPRFVLVWRDGVELENIKHPSYAGRTSVFTEELNNGNISLKLSKVKISDGGTYRCFIPEFNIVSTVQLVVGQPQVVGPPQPIVALVGEDIILPSRLEPPVNTFGMTVEWTRPDLDPRFVLVWRDGVELENKKHPSYAGRASVFTDELKRGNVSLKLSEVKISDGGTYRCFIPDFNIVSTVQLVVGAASSPVVQMTKNRSTVLLQCESEGWYPEPEVSWLDGEGHVLFAGPTETVRGPDGLYDLSSRVTVETRYSDSFTCRVQQKKINQTRETQIHMSDYYFEVQSSSASTISTLAVLLAFCCVFIFVVLFFWCKWRQRIIKIKRSDEDRETGLLRTEEPEEMNVLDKREKQTSKHSSLNLYKCFKNEHQSRKEAERSLKKQVKNLTEEKQRVETELEKKTKELSEEKQRSEKERQQLQTELETTRTKFKDTNENINTQLEKTHLQVKRKDEDISQLGRELEKLQQDLKQTEEKAEEDLKELTTKHEEHVKNLKAESERKLNELKTQLEVELENLRWDLKQTEEKAEKDLKELKNKHQELENDKREADRKWNETDRKLRVANTQLTSKNETIGQLEKQKLTEQNQRNEEELKKKLENKENELTEEKQKLQEEKNKVQTLTDEKKRIEKELQEKTKELTEEKKKSEQLQNEPKKVTEQKPQGAPAPANKPDNKNKGEDGNKGGKKTTGKQDQKTGVHV